MDLYLYNVLVLEDGEDVPQEKMGITIGESFHDALERIEIAYDEGGNTLINVYSLTPIEEYWDKGTVEIDDIIEGNWRLKPTNKWLERKG